MTELEEHKHLSVSYTKKSSLPQAYVVYEFLPLIAVFIKAAVDKMATDPVALIFPKNVVLLKLRTPVLLFTDIHPRSAQ
ncbi:hypothetical protein [Paenibacillus sp. 22594]|uniref:hypothetical protein n=1 Tax=Paenibacillus sp. 22594 TaxID=3453947 RepID=UPI003F880014